MKKEFKQHLEEGKGAADSLQRQISELLRMRKALQTAKRSAGDVSNQLRTADLQSLGAAKKYHDLAVADSNLEPIWNDNLNKKLTDAKMALDAMWQALDDADTIAEMQIRYASDRKKQV